MVRNTGNIVFGFEVHPGDAVYNTSSLLKLRKEVGSQKIGCCFDPAHLFWQGMDPVSCIRRPENLIFHVHAQDGELNQDALITREEGIGKGKEFLNKIIHRQSDEIKY